MKQDVAQSMLKFSLCLFESYSKKLPIKKEDSLEFYLVDKTNFLAAGIITCTHVTEPTPKLAKSFKRKINESENYSSSKKLAVSAPQSVARKDAHTALKALNLMPEIGSDLACASCSYIATQKGNLKTHYKLKHLGGADLLITCQLCSIQIKTKQNIKKHYIRVHCLSEAAAQSMASM